MCAPDASRDVLFRRLRMSPNYLPQIITKTFFVLLVSLALVTVADAQMGGLDPDSADAGTGGNTTLAGNVYLPSGQMLDRRVEVRLGTTSRGTMTTMTDSNGAFSFQRLASGTYTVKINEKGFETAEALVEIPPTRMRGSTLGRTVTVQIHLKAKAAETKTGVVSAEFANVPSDALECYRKAIQLAQAGDNHAAIEQLKKAVAIYSQFVMAFNELGVQYMRVGDMQNASKSIEAALKIAPDAFVPRLNKGILLVLSSHYAEAEPALRAALAQNDQSGVAHYYLGRTLARLRKFDEAETQLTRALELNPEEVKEAHRYLGAIYNERGDDARAVHELETYLQLVPNAKDAEQIRTIIRQLKQSNSSSGRND